MDGCKRWSGRIAQVMVCAGDVGNEADVLAMFAAIKRQWG